MVIDSYIFISTLLLCGFVLLQQARGALVPPRLYLFLFLVADTLPHDYILIRNSDFLPNCRGRGGLPLEEGLTNRWVDHVGVPIDYVCIDQCFISFVIMLFVVVICRDSVSSLSLSLSFLFPSTPSCSPRPALKVP